MTLDDLITSYIDSGGTLDELQTAGYAAWSYIYQQSQGRICSYDGDDTMVCGCFVELVRTIHGRRSGGLVASETVGPWTRSFVDATAGQTEQQLATAIIRRWLGETGLLYRGWP